MNKLTEMLGIGLLSAYVVGCAKSDTPAKVQITDNRPKNICTVVKDDLKLPSIPEKTQVLFAWDLNGDGSVDEVLTYHGDRFIRNIQTGAMFISENPQSKDYGHAVVEELWTKSYLRTPNTRVLTPSQRDRIEAVCNMMNHF